MITSSLGGGYCQLNLLKTSEGQKKMGSLHTSLIIWLFSSC